jgi:hypothetical protein
MELLCLLIKATKLNTSPRKENILTCVSNCVTPERVVLKYLRTKICPITSPILVWIVAR